MRVRHLLIILLCIIIFLGCGGGGGSGVGPELVSGHISGQIIFDDTLANERAIIASHSTLRASVFDNALVFLEEMPSRAVYADSDGKFIFTDLPLDTSFHVIARVNSLNGNSYKTRSEEINLTKSKAHITENIRIDKASEAKYQIRLQVKDTRDNNVARCKIWFWGEEFTLDESGSYLSPKMPLGASGNLKIIPPSNKDLLTLDCKIDSTTFQSEIQGVSAVTLPPLGITQKKAPYVSIKVGETLPGGFAIRLYGNAIDPQNDTLELEWSATVGSFTYESIDKKYVDWAVPTEETTAIITLKATQISSLVYPMFWSQAELPVKISKNGSISYPGEIVVKPVSRVFDVVSSATEQITGNTVSSYEIIASFPNDSNLSYTWENSDGSIISGVNNKRMFWRSPTLSANEFKLATLTAYVSDDIATVTKNILVKVTTFPVVTFSSPADSDFYPGLISFRGSAKDYLGNFISYDNFRWYLATFPNELQLIQNEGASFSYDFSTQGSYTVYLSAKDSSGVVGTGSMLISIFNCPPDISILSPENDGGYSSKNHLVFKAKVSDYEDGEITSSEQIKWFSDIDGLIGSGTYFINDKLTKNKKHTISVEAKDSMGQISSTSIIIWYDMPARIVLTPESGAVFYEGSEIALSARGIDANGALLASSTYKWYLDGSDTHWKSGIDSFVAKDLSAGLHSIKVVGSNDNGKVTSEDCYFEVGWPLPKITSPASGTRFDPETDITFTATPPSSGSLVLSWQIDDGETLFANNNKLTKKLDVGRHTICYQGMDYSGVFASSSIDIVVERLPQIELNIASGSSFFINQQIVFHAECKDSLNNSIGDENIKWYFLDSGSPVFWKTGSLLYMHQGSTEGALAPGLHTIRVEATGPHGSIASKSFSFESGIAPIDIEKPLPDTSYKANENILFEANLKKESMPVAWYIDNVLIHTGSAPFNHSFESNGIYSVKAIATDSANVASSKEMLLCVGLNPVIDFYVKNVKNEEIDPSDFIIFEEKPIVFVGSGTNPIDSSSISGSYMTWTIYNEDGTTVQQPYSGQSEFTLTIGNLSGLSPGTRTVELKCQLSDGLVGKKTKQMYFNLPVATYTSPASDTFIPFDDYTSDTIVCSAEGYPDSVGGINYEWYLNWGKDGCNKLEDSDIDSDGMQLRLNKGENSLTLVATDSLGQVSAITKKIIVDNRPVLAFSPPEDYANSDAYIFDTCEVTLKASGSTAVATGSLLTNYKWYLGEDFINAKTSINGEITGSELGLVTGENIVTLTAEDQFGLVATVSHNIYCGEQLPSILSPEDNHVFQNTNFNIEATGSEHITMNWTLNTNQLSEEHSNILSFEINDLRLNNGDNSITYGGKDSAGNIKTASLNFKYADSDYLPKIEMKYANSTEEVRDSVLFEYEETDNITINGSAIDGSNNPIEASKMTWTLHKQGNEGDKTPFESVSSLLLSRSQLNSVGTWTLTLTATDESGFIATQTQSFYYGYPKPKILFPSNESSFSYKNNSSIELEGSYSELVSINMDWLIDGVKEGSGKTYTYTFNRGYHTITYIGTDSAGVSKQDTVVCIVNDNPSLEVKYKKIDGRDEVLENNSKFFVDCELELVGTAKKADGTELEDSNVAWIKYTSETDSGTNLVTGTKTPTLTNSMLGVGTWNLSFKAEDKDFSSYGFSESYVSSFTKKITTGIETPRFIGATAGERIDEDGSITFTVNDISPIDGYWSVEGHVGSYPVTEKAGDNMTFTLQLDNDSFRLSRGNHKVYYTGTDSTGKTYTAETSILVDSGPKFKAGFPKISLNPPQTGSVLPQLGTATIDGLDYIIIKSDSDAQNLTLSADTISESDSVEWTNLSGTQSYSSNRSLSRNFLVGSYTYKVTITDEFGVNNSDTLSFWIWRYETYDCASPTHIVSNNNSELFVVEDKKTLAKYTRVIDEAAFNSGDIASVASSVSDTDITGLCYADSNLYSLTKDLKYYKWNTSELATDSEITIDDSSITDIGGFLIKNNRVYISDKSGSDNYVKIFYLSGNYWFQSSSSFKQPSDITADSGNNIYVADNQNNKIINLDLDGNDDEHIDGVESPLGLVYSATTNRLYVTGKNSDNNPCVYVIDLSSYRVLYSFDLDGAYDLAICGTGTNSDLYITDKDGKKIIRLRSNYSW